ncbi:Ig-like domain-containing protein [Tateyamaria sp. SN6-1]|uniref:Ig-like domain-containing protein n=1 Tax=Tateyamaria sp. SN6-1 TaxID=3092148 RepID=UPI0039F61A7E
MTKFIDFNNLAAGTVVDDEFKADGVTISAIGGSNKAMIFDTANPTGGDSDLATSNLGKVLIISEDGDSHDPDDNADGGTLRFKFDQPSTVEALTFLDIEESAWVKFYDEDGKWIKTVDVHGVKNNGQREVHFNVEGVARMDVILGGSGAIDNLKFAPALDGIVEGTDAGDLIDADYEGDPEGDKIDNNDAILPGEAPQDDIVLAGGGNDTVKSGAGDDDVSGGSGKDSIDGGSGNDLLKGEGGADRIFGGTGNDTIDGGAGNDTLGGADFGDDVFLGGAGNDMVEASFGNDTIDGGSGNDDLWASADDDLVNGGTGRDNINGGQGKDVLFGDEDEDTVFGGSGDDTIDGGEGNDQLFGDGNFKDDTGAAGDDLIKGGDGDDTIDGMDGDDTIFGDNMDGGGVTVVGRESFNWEDVSEGQVDTSVDQNTGSVTVTYERITDTGSHESSLSDDDLNTDGIDGGGETVDDDTGLRSVTNGQGNDGDFQWTFSEPVGNVDFNINDLDGDGVVTVTAFDADGNEIPVTLTGGSDVTVNGNVADSNGGYDDTDSDDYNVQVSIAGPVSKIVVEHDQDGGDNSGIVITDIFFDVLEDGAGEGGDDVITGGAGADAMFGEGGDDTFIVDNASDADGDVIEGGNGPDDTTDNDVLDLRGAGQVTIVSTDDGTDTGAQTGTVTFEDGSVLEFSQIETILTDPQNEAPTANDDDITVDEDGEVTFDPTANDVDPDGDPLEVDSFTQPDNGTVTQNPDGTLTYTPDPNFNGTDSFTVTVTDPSGETSTSTVNVTVDPVNDAPDAVNDVAETDEETPVTIDVLDNDTDVDGDDLTITAASVPSEQGTVDIVNNELVFTPAEDFFGEATISYSIEDGNGGTDVAEVTVTVNNVNDDPIAVDDIAETDEDTPVTIDVLDNDEDADGDDLTISSATVPADQGTVEIVNNELVFTPAENFNGPATITYTVDDGNGGTDEGTATVNVAPVNDGPTANDDIAETDEDTPVTIDVVANDEDPDGDTLTITDATVPADQGTVDIVNNELVFTPAPDFNGDVTISYTVEDPSGEESSAEVSVTVNPVQDAPVTVDDTATTDEDTPVTIDPLANDSDPDGDPLEISGTPVAENGTVTVNPDGTIEYTPDENFNGTDTITYIATDPDGNETEGTITVTVDPVNDAPDAVDDSDTTDEDVAITVDLLANDTDVDGDDLTVTEATLADPSTGTLDDNGDGTVTFTPAPNFNGPVEINYTISDGNGGTDSAIHTINVAPQGDAPVTVDDTATTDEDTPVTIDPLANDSDPDGDPLEISGTPVAENGTVTVNPDGTIEYTPNENFNGTDTITYIAEDPEGNQTEGTITVTVDPVNDAPDAVNDVAETDEETPVTIDVLDNDTDVDGDDLTITAASVPSEQGTVDIVNNELVFTPAEDFFGEATISYSIEDGNGGTDVAEVTVTVNNVNDDPIAVDDIAETDEDTPVTIDVLDNDEDADGDDLTILDASVPADQGTVEIVDNELVFTPAENFNGPATITYTVDDGNGGTDEGQALVNVGAVNDGPTAIDDSETTDEDTPVTIDVVANDEDPDGDDLIITAASVPADQGTVDIVDNKLVFTPAENFNGDVTIDYSITDGNGGTDSAQVDVTVVPVNDDPVAVDDIETTDEDVAVVVDLLGNDSDVDGDDLTIASLSVDPSEGTVVDNGDGTVTFTPAPNFNGPATITYTVSDGNGGTDEGEAVVSVGAVNDSPIAEDDTATTDEDTPVTISVLDNDEDPDGDPLSVVSATVPADQGTVEIVDDELVFTPAPDFNGEATITYTITDGNGLNDTADVVVTVNPVDDAPVTEDDLAETDEDTPVTIDPLANDEDPDGQPLEIAGTPVAENGTVTVNPDGTIEYTPDPDFNGTDTITYVATDPDGNETPGTITVTVNPVDDAPVAEDDIAETDEDTPVDIAVLDNDADPDGQDLTVTEATSPNGTVDINPDGTITFTPDENFNGPTTISYTVQDPDGNEDTATVDVNVVPVNDAPEAVDDSDTTPFNTPVTVAVLGNDFDVDGDDIEVLTATSDDGTVDVNADGTITFTPNDGFEGVAVVDYTIQDEEGLTDTAQVLITVEDDPRDGIVSGTDDGELIDEDYDGDPEGDFVDNADNIFDPNNPDTEDDDIIEAGGGDDTILAGDGADLVDAGTGNDDVEGGDGNDTINGEDGNDTIDGGDGNDSVDGGDGNDVIDTSNGDFAPDLGFPNDDGTPIPGFPFGFAADDEPDNDLDFVDGGDGDDTISTGDDADTIIGGDGNDVIDGGIDDDIIDGDDTTNPSEGGADRIVGGEGNDLITGGVGDDTIFAGNDPDLGLDQLNIEDDGSNPLFPADPVPDNGKDTVFGGEGNDFITGADDDDELFGEEGNDTIDGEIDDDLVDGGVGNDSLLGGQGNDTVIGGTGEDTLEGGTGNDVLDGGDDNDTINGDQGRDIIDGGEGDDLIDGGLNADFIEGGDGADTIFGGNGKDTIDGGDGDDVIDGGTGDDSLDGGAGNDSITGATGDDTIDGGDGNDTIDGGNGGTDVMFGGADRDLFVNVSAGETVDGGGDGDDFDTLDLTGSTGPNSSLQVTFTNPDDNGNGFDGFVTYFDNEGNEVGRLEFTDIEDVIPCFTPGTLIATPTGERRVEDLNVGDRVITRDNGIQEIRWVGQREMTGAELEAAPQFKPVLIRAGALGKGLPERDMLVSPQHRVLMSGEKTELYFDESEVLVAAKHLTGMDGIDVVDVSATTYIHVMFEQHEVILSDGAWTESFQPGDMTLGAMGDAQRAEILALFPELETADGIEAYTAARRSLKKHEARLLTQ